MPTLDHVLWTKMPLRVLLVMVVLLCTQHQPVVPVASAFATRLSSSATVKSSSCRARPNHPVSPCLLTINNNDVESIDLDEQLRQCQTATAARCVLDQAFRGANNDNTPLFGSISIPRGASSRAISDGDFRVMTRTANTPYDLMEVIDLSGNYEMDAFAMTLLNVMISSSVASIVAQQNLPDPDILRFVVVWFLTFAPLLVLARFGFTEAARQKEDEDISKTTSKSMPPSWLAELRLKLPSTGTTIDTQRRLQHEAGHLVMAHLLGWPVQGYTIGGAGSSTFTAVALYPLADPDAGSYKARQLGFDVRDTTATTTIYPTRDTTNENAAYFSNKGRGARMVQENSVFRKEPNATTAARSVVAQTTWPYRGLGDETLDQLAVISVAGVCAEVLAFGNAHGGRADWNQLETCFTMASSQNMDAREKENRVRFALAFALAQLRQHLTLLDVVTGVMERGGSLAECLVAMEQEYLTFGGKDSVSGGRDYELQRRRDRFANNRRRIDNKLEAMLQRLGMPSSTKSLWQDESNNSGGRRGQEQPRVFLPGDDPFYAAAGIAAVFLLWASSGGLTLH